MQIRSFPIHKMASKSSIMSVNYGTFLEFICNVTTIARFSCACYNKLLQIEKR